MLHSCSCCLLVNWRKKYRNFAPIIDDPVTLSAVNGSLDTLEQSSHSCDVHSIQVDKFCFYQQGRKEAHVHIVYLLLLYTTSDDIPCVPFAISSVTMTLHPVLMPDAFAEIARSSDNWLKHFN